MLSQTAAYALRAVLYLADRRDAGPVGAEEIGAVLGMPPAYLSKTLNTLVAARVLSSQRGRHGGFHLEVPPDELPLVRVVGPFDDAIQRRYCLLGRSECSDRTACAAHATWKATADRIARYFRTTTVADIKGTVSQLSSR